jgi:hypothetical protein
MPLSEESVCANPVRVECRLPSLPLWISDPFEIPDPLCDTLSDPLQMRPRAVAWGVLISAPLWGTFFLAGRALWSLWR